MKSYVYVWCMVYLCDIYIFKFLPFDIKLFLALFCLLHYSQILLIIQRHKIQRGPKFITRKNKNINNKQNKKKRKKAKQNTHTSLSFFFFKHHFSFKFFIKSNWFACDCCVCMFNIVPLGKQQKIPKYLFSFA